MNRRRFIALCGAAVPGLWLAGAGLIQLPRRMVIALSGRCSFCGKAAEEVFGLAGVTGRPARICNECIEICLEILRDDMRPEEVSASPSVAEHLDTSEVIGQEFEVTFEVTEVLRQREEPRTGSELADLMEQVRQLLSQPEAGPQPISSDELACSFCDRRQSETRKLVAGPQNYICEVCIGDAAAIISMHS